MHEFELGVWKGLFTHLVRLLNAIGSSKVVEMDRRYVLFKNLTYEVWTKKLQGIVKSLALVGEEYGDSPQTPLK